MYVCIYIYLHICLFIFIFVLFACVYAVLGGIASESSLFASCIWLLLAVFPRTFQREEPQPLKLLLLGGVVSNQCRHHVFECVDIPAMHACRADSQHLESCELLRCK